MVSCLGLLVQSCGEGGALQTKIAGVCGEHSQCFGHTGFAPTCSMCFPRLHCSGSRLLYKEWALSCVHFPGLSCSDSGFRVLHKDVDSVGPAFCAFPGRSSSGSQELDERTLPGCGTPSPLHSPSLSFPPHQLGACAFSPPRPQPQSPPPSVRCLRLCLAVTLLADVDHPESQEVFG